MREVNKKFVKGVSGVLNFCKWMMVDTLREMPKDIEYEKEFYRETLGDKPDYSLIALVLLLYIIGLVMLACATGTIPVIDVI